MEGDGGVLNTYNENENNGPLHLNVTGVRIEDVSGAEEGGAFYLRNCEECVVEDSVFRRVSAVQIVHEGGGSIWSYKNAGFLISNVTFEQCMGGGVHLAKSNHGMMITNSTFTRCTASYGGGVYLGENNDDLTITSSIFTGCSAERGGG